MRKDYLPLAQHDSGQLNESVSPTTSGDDKRIRCFEDQTKYFTVISTIACLFQVILGLVGLFGLQDGTKLSCSVLHAGETSGQWIYITNGANTFATMHVIAIIIQCASVNSALYKVPKNHGVFNEWKEEVELRQPLVPPQK